MSPLPSGTLLRGPALSMLTKLIASPIVAGAWLIAAHVVVRELGASGYAVYMLVAGLAVLLPFADLGLGVAVMDAFARRGTPEAPDPRLVLVTTWRVLVKTAALVALIALVIGWFQAWTPVLGLPGGGSTNVAISVCVALFAIGLPVSVGPRILSGLERNHWAVGFQAMSAILMVLLVYVIAAFSPRIELFVLAPFIGALVSNTCALLVGLRQAELGFTSLARLVYGRRKVAGATVRHVAGPMLIISIVLPLAYQLDRVILSHFASVSDVAEYSLVYQVFSPMLGVLGSAGVALWPVFTRDRLGEFGIQRRSVLISEVAFISLGILMAAVIIWGTPPVASIVAGPAIDVSLILCTSFAGLLLIQAASYPLAMILTDARELKIQAALHVVMLAINLPLSIWFAQVLGAPGPVLASVVAIAAALLGPQLIRVWKLTRATQSVECC